MSMQNKMYLLFILHAMENVEHDVRRIDSNKLRKTLIGQLSEITVYDFSELSYRTLIWTFTAKPWFLFEHSNDDNISNVNKHGGQDQLKRAVDKLSVMQMEVQLLTFTLICASRLAGCTKSQITSLIHRSIH